MVKVAKPSQDQRVDLPAVGPATISAMKKVAISALLVEAGKSVVLDRDELVRRANSAGIAVVAW